MITTILQDLKTSITEAISNRKLELGPALIQNAGLIKLMQAHLGKKVLSLTNVTVKEKGNLLFVKGSLSKLLNISNLGVEIAFLDIDDNEELVCKFAVPRIWNFNDSFPNLPAVGPNGNVNGRGPSFLGQLKFSKPQVVFSSFDFSRASGASFPFDGIDHRQIKPGLNVGVELTTNGLLGDLKNIIGNTPKLSLMAHLQPNGKDGMIRINKSIATNTKIGALTLSVNELSIFSSVSKTAVKPIAGFALGGAITVGEQRIEVSLEGIPGEDLLIVRSRTGLITIPSLISIADLLGGQNLSQMLPDSFSDPGALSLDGLEMILAPSQKQINAVKGSIRCSGNWEVIPKVLTLSQVVLAFQIDQPQDPVNRKTELSAEGFLLMGNAKVTTRGHHPDWQLSANLEKDHAVSVDDIFKNFFPQLRDIPQVALSDFRLNANPKAGTFDGKITMKNDWVMEFNGIEIALASLTLEMAHANHNTTGILQGTMALMDLDFSFLAAAPQGGKGWHFNAKTLPGESVQFTSIANRLLPQNFKLPAGMPEIAFGDVNIAIHTQRKELVLQARSTENWAIAPQFSIQRIGLDLMLQSPADAPAQFKGKLKGGTHFMGTTLQVEAELQEELTFRAILSDLSFSAIVDQFLEGMEIPAQIPDLTFISPSMLIKPQSGEFTLKGTSEEVWELDLGVTGLSIGDVEITVNRSKAPNNQGKVHGSIGGNLDLGGVNLDLHYNFPGHFVLKADLPAINLSALLQDLMGAAALIGFPAPPNLMNISINDVKMEVAPQAKSFALSGKTPIGETEVKVKKTRAGKMGFAVGFAPPSNWSFSNLDPSLKSLDALKFEDTALIISSVTDTNLGLTNVQPPDKKLKVQKGVNLFASLDMTGLGLDDLMQLESLSIYAAIGPNPAALVIEGGIDGTFPVSDTISFGDMKLRLQPFPSNFAIGVRGSMLATLDNSPLTFIGGMDIKPIDRSASFLAMMDGTWNEPFGTKGVAISDLALEVGIGIVPPPAVAAPIIGLAGGLRIGSFIGSAAVKFDSVNPSKSMLAVAFNELYVREIIQAFTTPEVFHAIPPEIKTTVLDFSMREVDVRIVPQPTRIADIQYEPGFKIAGKMNIMDIGAEILLDIDYTKGIYLNGQIEEINLAELFVLTGANGQRRAKVELDLRLGGKPKVEISGAVRILGLSRETYLAISDSGMDFMIEGKIFDLFEARLEVHAGSMKNAAEFHLKATMRNDLFAYLREHTTKAIMEAAEAATRELSEAQQDIDKAQQTVNNLNGEIQNMRNTIRRERQRDEQNVRNARNAVQSAQNKVNQINRDINNMRAAIRRERERDARRIRDARNAVTAAQSKVNALYREINNMRATIRRERERDARRLRDARKAVSDAQRKVNGIQSEINSSKRRINTLNGDIARKKRWYNNLSWWNKSWGWAEYAAYAAAKGAEITALYSKIGALETAKATANGVLEAAKFTLRQMEAAAKTFPIDADPRIAGLFTAKETANAALEAAKFTLRQVEAAAKTFPIDADPRIAALFTARGTANAAMEAAKFTLKQLEAVIKTFPIDADPRIAGLFTALGTATASLSAAKAFLEGLKSSIGAIAEVSQFIAENALGGLLDIRSASFEAGLSSATGGRVKLNANLIFMKQPSTIAFAFNFHDPLESARDLAKQLLDSVG